MSVSEALKAVKNLLAKIPVFGEDSISTMSLVYQLLNMTIKATDSAVSEENQNGTSSESEEVANSATDSE